MTGYPTFPRGGFRCAMFREAVVQSASYTAAVADVEILVQARQDVSLLLVPEPFDFQPPTGPLLTQLVPFRVGRLEVIGAFSHAAHWLPRARRNLRPGLSHTGLECQLLVYRDKGDPSEVRRKLRAAVAAIRAAEPPLPPPAPPAVAGKPDPEAAAILADPAYYGLLVDAVDAAGGACTLAGFVRCVGLEFGPAPAAAVWKSRLEALERAGVLEECRAGTELVGYRVTDAGRCRRTACAAGG